MKRYCKECLEPFENERARMFCSEKCRKKYNTDVTNARTKAIRDELPKPKSGMIPCLGHLCRGERMFKSYDIKHNRICKGCRRSAEFQSDAIDYGFRKNGRTARS